MVLAISAGSMGFAYLGFERVSAVVDAYRRSVQEADLARDIDRELISYRALARYFVATGKEEDGKAALAAEAALKDAIVASMKGTTDKARLEQIAKLEREFRTFTKIFADILKIKDDSARIVQNQLARNGNSLRYKLDDLPSNADEEELQVITLGAKKVTEQFQAATALANTFVVNADQSVANSALARLKFVENALKAISTTNAKILDGIKEVSGMLEEYRRSLAMLIGNVKEIEGLIQEMTETAAEINKASAAMKSDLLADQKRLDAESDAAIAETERLIVMLAAGGFLLGCIWAFFLGKGISRPMTRMCSAMRELAAGNFDVVLPGLGRKDEIGEMAGAVEEFKVQAVARAERDAASQEAQNKAASAARRAELIRFADDFEAAVGAIVSNVSSSAVQLEAAAGTLTRTAETTQSLSSQVAGASEEASSNMQSVASATEELSASVDEIGRRVKESEPDRGCRRPPGRADRRPHRQAVARRAGDRRRRQADHGDRRADQSAGAQRHHRGGPRGRVGPRLRGRRVRGQVARQPDREGDRRDLQSHLGHAGRDAGVGRRHQGDRRHHRQDFRHRLDDRQRRRAAELGDAGNRAQRPERRARHAGSRRQRHAGQSRRDRNRLGLGRSAELGAQPVERKHEAPRRARSLHGEYQGGVRGDLALHAIKTLSSSALIRLQRA